MVPMHIKIANILNKKNTASADASDKTLHRHVHNIQRIHAKIRRLHFIFPLKCNPPHVKVRIINIAASTLEALNPRI